MATRIRSLRPELVARLRHGEHLVLYGPRGSGKSTLLAELETRLTRANAPCARSTATNCLNDITRTLEEAYPAVDTHEVSRHEEGDLRAHAHSRSAIASVMLAFFRNTNANR